MSLLLVAVLLAVAQLYVLGANRRRPRDARRRALAFASALVLIELVLCPPFHRIADESLAGHMLQHVVLMSFAPLLLVLAAPWLTVWRGLPLTARRRLARRVLALPVVLRRSLRGLVSPWPAWLLINADLAAWHVPSVYDLTLRSGAAHYLEHATFLFFGTLFWIPVLDSPPLRARLTDLQAAGYVLAGSATGWVLAVVLALAPAPLYPAYAVLHHRLFGLSALADQQLAGGVMLGIGSLPYTIAVFFYLYRWLDEGRATSPHPRRSARTA